MTTRECQSIRRMGTDPSVIEHAAVELCRRGVLEECGWPDCDGVGGLLVNGRRFFYRSDFWCDVGVWSPAGEHAWLDRDLTPRELAAVRIRIIGEWAAAGAPAEWAHCEADQALLFDAVVEIPWIDMAWFGIPAGDN